MAKDGNVQDMAVDDKAHPSLAATHESQDVAAKNQIVVPMPSYNDPSNPNAAAGSINLDLDEHPNVHSEDYGAGILNERESVQSVIDTHAAEMGEVDDDDDANTAPEDRDEWLKSHWQDRARELGLATSGNMDALQKRVKEQETVDEEYADLNAEEWKAEVDSVQDAGELGDLRAAYDRSGKDYSTVAAAFDAKQSELTAQ